MANTVEIEILAKPMRIAYTKGEGEKKKRIQLRKSVPVLIPSDTIDHARVRALHMPFLPNNSTSSGPTQREE